MSKLQGIVAVVGIGIVACYAYASWLRVFFHVEQRGVDRRVYMSLACFTIAVMAIAQYFLL